MEVWQLHIATACMNIQSENPIEFQSKFPAAKKQREALTLLSMCTVYKNICVTSTIFWSSQLHACWWYLLQNFKGMLPI